MAGSELNRAVIKVVFTKLCYGSMGHIASHIFGLFFAEKAGVCVAKKALSKRANQKTIPSAHCSELTWRYRRSQ